VRSSVAYTVHVFIIYLRGGYNYELTFSLPLFSLPLPLKSSYGVWESAVSSLACPGESRLSNTLWCYWRSKFFQITLKIQQLIWLEMCTQSTVCTLLHCCHILVNSIHQTIQQ